MEDSSFQSPVNQFNYTSPEVPKKPKKFVYIILLLIIIVGFFLTRSLFFGSSQQEETSTETPTPTEYQFPTDTPTPSISPAEEEEEEPTVVPTAKVVDPVDASTGLDRSTLSVEIQNGSGEVGAAARAADVLKGFGYGIEATGNADNYDYQDATIMIKSTKSNFLALLKKDLGFSYTVGSTSADLDSSSIADALVIIGK